ncbi:hypothetical protein ACFZA1_30420 [Streptomyces filipinensis]|uniref:hypothetical protein n=1 Tax=Streptomyces filipinensis TaxID=66887 RepID=UPI0036EE5607
MTDPARVYDDLPRRRNKNAVQHARAIIAAMGMLSESLRVQRPDRGAVPAARGRSDIVAFTHRMGYFTSTEQISPARRLAFTRFVRRVLLRFRALDLTSPGQMLEGMPTDFAISPEDMPDEPEDTEAGRDLPEEVMRELCARFDELEAMSSIEVRVATELLIDTGRRPDEINTLALNCLEQDSDGSDVLVYDNHKAYRLARRPPIGAETAATIRRQQQRVRERFPTADQTRLRLLPRSKTNPEGTNPSWISPPITGPGWTPSPISSCRSSSSAQTAASRNWCRSTGPGSSPTPSGTPMPGSRWTC